MAEIKLTTLHCFETEDFCGEDEIKLEMRSDKIGYNALSRDMNDGDTWHLEYNIPFNSKIIIDLWDMDSSFFGEDNDHLGTVVIQADNLAGCGSFTEDGANYQICWIHV